MLPIRPKENFSPSVLDQHFTWTHASVSLFEVPGYVNQYRQHQSPTQRHFSPPSITTTAKKKPSPQPHDPPLKQQGIKRTWGRAGKAVTGSTPRNTCWARGCCWQSARCDQESPGLGRPFHRPRALSLSLSHASSRARLLKFTPVINAAVQTGAGRWLPCGTGWLLCQD